MTDDEKLEMLKNLMGDYAERFTDDQLKVYLRLAAVAVMDWRYGMDYEDDREFPSRYDTHQVRIAQFLVQRAGAEGETQHSENGISRSYGNADIPHEYFTGIVPMAGVLR